MAVISPALITTLIDSAYLFLSPLSILPLIQLQRFPVSSCASSISLSSMPCCPLLPSLTLLCLFLFCSSQLSQWCHVFLLKSQTHIWPLLPLQLLLPFPFICKFTQCAVSGAPLLTPFLSYSPTALQQPFLKHSWTFQIPFGVTMHPEAPCAGCSQPSYGQGDSPFWSHPSFVPISMFFPYFLISFAEEILCRAFLISNHLLLHFGVVSCPPLISSILICKFNCFCVEWLLTYLFLTSYSILNLRLYLPSLYNLHPPTQIKHG